MAEEERAAQPGARPRKVWRQFRMAYCATLTLHDRQGEAVHTLRYGRMPQGEVDLLSEAGVLRAERLLVGTEDEALVLEDPDRDPVRRDAPAAARAAGRVTRQHLVVVDRLLEVGDVRETADEGKTGLDEKRLL